MPKAKKSSKISVKANQCVLILDSGGIVAAHVPKGGCNDDPVPGAFNLMRCVALFKTPKLLRAVDKIVEKELAAIRATD